MNTPVWQLQAFDRAGNIIGTITKHPNLPVVRTGAPGAFALFATCDMDAALVAELEARLFPAEPTSEHTETPVTETGDHDFTIGGEIRVQEVEQRLDLLSVQLASLPGWDGRPF